MTGVPRAVALGIAAGCGGGTVCDAPVVLGASDLQAALTEVATLREQETGCRPVVATGASGALAAQIRGGAPVDLFLSADAGFVDGLVADGLADASTRATYAVGHLALIAAPGRSPPGSVAALAEPVWRTVAIANPEHAPYGRLGAAALRAAGVAEAVGPKLVFGENVAQTWQMVETGNADAGLVARSLAVGRGAVFTEVAAAEAPPLQQVAVVPVGAPHAEAGRALLDWLRGTQGRAVLERHGFGLP